MREKLYHESGALLRPFLNGATIQTVQKQNITAELQETAESAAQREM
jgi:hypothetical protein